MRTFPPGEFIRDELVARGWSESDLAYKLGISVRGVAMLLSGHCKVGPMMSKSLGKAFDVSPELFANLQRAFDACKGGGVGRDRHQEWTALHRDRTQP